jgi:hypothetical protein
MSLGEGLGYFVEMVRGDWEAGEHELRKEFNELASMGDKNYLAITSGWLAHCLYELGRLEEADEHASICERAAAQVLPAAARAPAMIEELGPTVAAASVASPGRRVNWPD